MGTFAREFGSWLSLAASGAWFFHHCYARALRAYYVPLSTTTALGSPAGKHEGPRDGRAATVADTVPQRVVSIIDAKVGSYAQSPKSTSEQRCGFSQNSEGPQAPALPALILADFQTGWWEEVSPETRGSVSTLLSALQQRPSLIRRRTATPRLVSTRLQRC